jgi:hypothetical protein
MGMNALNNQILENKRFGSPVQDWGRLRSQDDRSFISVHSLRFVDLKYRNDYIFISD